METDSIPIEVFGSQKVGGPTARKAFVEFQTSRRLPVLTLGCGTGADKKSNGDPKCSRWQRALFASLANANIALGYNAGSAFTRGGSNTALGFSSPLAAATGVQNTVVGSNAYVSGNFSNSTAVGYQAQPTASNQVVLGNGAVNSFIVSMPPACHVP